MKTRQDRMDELVAEATALGIADRIHQLDFDERLMAYADMLGYDYLTAGDPELPLRRVRPAEK